MANKGLITPTISQRSSPRCVQNTQSVQFGLMVKPTYQTSTAWSADSIVSNNYNQSINSSFLKCCHDNGPEQIIEFPTRHDNLLDILLTNRPSIMGRTDPVPGVSDDEGVLASTLTKARGATAAPSSVLLQYNSGTLSVVDDYTNTVCTTIKL